MARRNFRPRGNGFLYDRLAKALRDRRGDESLVQFSKKAGIATSTLHRIENREQNVSLDTLEVLCLRLKVDIFDLFSPDDPEGWLRQRLQALQGECS